MIRHLTIWVLFLSLSLSANAQDLQMGFLLGTNVYQKTIYEESIFSPESSYHTYIEEYKDEGIIDKDIVFNGINTGAIFNFGYKKFTFNLEPQYYYQRTTFNFEKPYPTQRVIGRRAFRLPVYATYKFFKNENSIYGIAGFVFNVEKTWDFQAPGIGYYLGTDALHEEGIDFGDNHFDGILYDDHAYWNYMVGFGKKINRFNMSVRYLNQLNITKHDIDAKIWQIELSVNILLLSSNDFTKKHFLYVD